MRQKGTWNNLSALTSPDSIIKTSNYPPWQLQAQTQSINQRNNIYASTIYNKR